MAEILKTKNTSGSNKITGSYKKKIECIKPTTPSN